MRKFATMLAALTGFLLVLRGPAEAGNTVPAVTNVIYRMYKGAVVGAVTNVEEGAFGYDAAEKALRYYDGSNWRSLLQADGSALQLSGIDVASVTAGVNTVTVELPLYAEYSEVPGGTGSNIHLSVALNIFTAQLMSVEYKPTVDLSGTLADPTVYKIRGVEVDAFDREADYSVFVYRSIAGPDEFDLVPPATFFETYETDPLWSAVSNTVVPAITDHETRIGDLEAAPPPTATIAWSNLYPMAGMSMGLDLLYHGVNTVQLNAGSIFGPSGEVYRVAVARTYTVAAPVPTASRFVYLFVDASASTPGAADGLVVTQSTTAPVRNSVTRQWVSYDYPEDRYLGCVLWLTDSPAGIAKFQYSQGAYELCDTRLFPAAATGISSWHAKVALGTQQTMTGAWEAPETDASTLLPDTACAALVGAVWSFYNSGRSPGAIGYAVISSEAAANGYGTDIFLTADRADAVWDLAPGGFAGRGGGPSQGAHRHDTNPGQTSEDPADLRTTVARTGWVQLGASRNLRIAADDFDVGAPVADWAILGWKEQR